MGAQFVHIFPLVVPVAEIVDIFVGRVSSTRKDQKFSVNGGRRWYGEKVGGRSGASGGRGRLRLRALIGIVSHIQHALLPLNEVRRIYVAFGEHSAAGAFLFEF